MITGYENKKGILLDIDNTLYAYEPCHAAALAACQGELGMDTDIFTTAYKTAKKTVQDRLNQTAAMHNRQLYFQVFIEQTIGRTDVEKSLALYATYWHTFLDNMTPFNWVIPFFKDCQHRQIPICLLTDLTVHIQLQKCVRLGISPYIHALVTSEEVGIEKPHRNMFEHGLQKLACHAHDAVMIGDSLTKDIHGAQELGIKTIHITP